MHVSRALGIGIHGGTVGASDGLRPLGISARAVDTMQRRVERGL